MTTAEAYVGLVKYVRNLCFVVLCFGLLGILKPINMVLHYAEYSPYRLKAESSHSGSSSGEAGGGNDGEVTVVGHAGTIRTKIILDQEHRAVDSLAFYHLKGIYPIWARTDGKYSVLRLPEEAAFPVEKHLFQLVRLVLFSFGPFIVTWLVHHFMGRRLRAKSTQPESETVI